MANVNWVNLEYVEDELAEDNIFLYDGNTGAWEYASVKTGMYGIESDIELTIFSEPTQIEGFGNYLIDGDGIYKYVVEFDFSKEALEEGTLIEEDEVYRIEEGHVITNDMWEDKELVDRIAEVDFNTTIWSENIYKVRSHKGELYCYEDDNGSKGWYEDFDEAVDDMIDGVDKAFVWHFGDDNHKKIKFGESAKNILTVAQDNNYSSFVIVNNIELQADNPAYFFPYLGLTDDGEIVYYSVNNCNVRTNDIPFVEKVYFDIEDVKKDFEDLDEDDLEKLQEWFEI